MKKLVSFGLSLALAASALSVGAFAEEDKTITVAASATPHAEILEQAKPLLEEQGWDLEVTVFDDYVQPNLVVESGDFDANYFQHIPYLENFNEEQGTHLVLLFSVLPFLFYCCFLKLFHFSSSRQLLFRLFLGF